MHSRIRKCLNLNDVRHSRASDVGIFLTHGDGGYHVGIVLGSHETHYLHMGATGLSTSEMPDRYPRLILDPNIDGMRLRTFASKCKLIYFRCCVDLGFAPSVPFSFGPRAVISDDPEVIVAIHAAEEGGFTCATFVLAVFEAVGIKILDITTVEAAADPEVAVTSRACLIAFLERHGVEGEILARLRRTSDHPRIAAECVASAMLEGPHPISYTHANDLSSQIVEALPAPAQSSLPDLGEVGQALPPHSDD